MEATDVQINESPSLILAFDAKRLFNNFTGLGNYSRTLIKNLQRFYPHHQYHLFTPKITKNEETIYFLDQEKFTVHTPKGFSPLWRTWTVSQEVNTLKPHLFHGLSHELPFGLDKDIKKVVTFHDLIYEKYPEQFGYFDQKMYHWKYRSAVKRANAVVAISESTKADLVAYYGVEASKILVIYQSCQDVFFDTIKEEGKLQTSSLPASTYYLYVGSIIERKGLLQLIIAYATLPEVYRKPLVIVGKGDKNYLNKVTDLIKYYRLQPYVHFVNGMTNADLVTLYDGAFALIYPSVYEGFGIPIIEALARKIPVITSDISSLPEACGPGAILVNPYEANDIAQAMIWLHDQTCHQSLSEKGFHYVKNRFSAEITAASMMDFYLSL